jgi:hypothetical protein
MYRELAGVLGCLSFEVETGEFLSPVSSGDMSEPKKGGGIIQT